MNDTLVRSWFAATVLIGAASVAGAGAPGAEQVGASDRLTRSAEGFATDRAPAALRDDMLTEATDSPQRRRSRTAKPGQESTLRSFRAGEAWIYDASVELFRDFDGDGYYHYLRVRFDADSYFDGHFVYARLFLSDDGDYWQQYYVTRDFLINGSSPFDDYEVETELVTGFPTGLYDVLIELYDADYGDFLAEFGPADSSAFALLPLEDLEYDTPPPIVIVTPEHGGGAVGGISLAVLGGLLLLRRRVLRRPAGAVAYSHAGSPE